MEPDSNIVNNIYRILNESEDLMDFSNYSLLRVTTAYWKSQRMLGHLTKIDEEGMIYADIDLEKCIQPKQMHDILGHYNRFDIFDLRVNTAPTRKITFIDNHEEFNTK
jgi:hypothetical protein